MAGTPAAGAHDRAPIVLLVDDNAAMRALIRSLIEEITPLIHEFEDGQEALDAYDGIRPDWVLMDIEMAGMDGIAATRAIRLLDPAARVVMVTAHGDEPYRRAAAAAGATAFVLKENLLELPPLLAAAAVKSSPDEGSD